MKQNNRALEISGFLEQSGWGDGDIMPFMADFSPRRYARLEKADGKTAILMDADPDQKTPSFVEMAELLRPLRLSSPQIYAAWPERGLVLMEDFGRNNFGRMLDKGVEAKPLYRRAIDVLVELHKNFVAVDYRQLDLPAFGGALFASQVELFLDAYFPYLHGREADKDEAESFRSAWKEALHGIEALPQSLLLRDYMPDNLMDMPDRADAQSVGILDFQDAGLGPIAYDIASLCEVVRRDGGDQLLDEMIGYYHEKAKPALPLEDLRRTCRVLAAQRHMRILGIIVRNVARTGQNEKLQYLPRIKDYLNFLMQNEALMPLKKWCGICGF